MFSLKLWKGLTLAAELHILTGRFLYSDLSLLTQEWREHQWWSEDVSPFSVGMAEPSRELGCIRHATPPFPLLAEQH